jgi:predicted  nucleic acid-binding Zn-ribbon protein
MSGKVLRWVDANFDADEQRALLAEGRDALDNALAQSEIWRQEVARLKARVGELEAEVKRWKHEAQNTSARRREKRQQEKLKMKELINHNNR